jgi:hypothetical protein
VRLHFVVEGQTEETFVRDMLAAELGANAVYCDVHRITTGRRKGKVFRGGMVSYQHLRNDLALWMKQDDARDSWFTTMIDLYRLPSEFPGLAESKRFASAFDRVKFVEAQFQEDISYPRFIPYVQLHEFEALLFADPECFQVAFPGINTELTALRAVRGQFQTPELIDDDCPPSKRICEIVPQYGKVSSGPLIANHIGLPTLRRECQHFGDWITTLLSVAGANQATNETPG